MEVIEMITNEQKSSLLKDIIVKLDIPDSAYEKAKKRYEDLSDWLSREESTVFSNDPHIFSQGSFRLGTAIRPIDERDHYDLDIACKLRNGITMSSHSQKELKEIIGNELETYRKSRGVKKELEEKHRCWRMEYLDELNFHMDIVPCIPADEERQKSIFESVRNTGIEESISKAYSHTTVSITDDRHKHYSNISYEWNISNPEGYALWFESRMSPKHVFVAMEKTQIDDIPLYKRKSPLQRAIQILKRHRDNWSKSNPESKPISIIITTLAARAYNGETELEEALDKILNTMESFINSAIPLVPNPVDPNEDFADRWYRQDSSHLYLEKNFRDWLFQAKLDFQNLTKYSDPEYIAKHLSSKFSVNLSLENLSKLFVVGGTNIVTSKQKNEIRNYHKLWGQSE
jgi:hypothetical protein